MSTLRRTDRDRFEVDFLDHGLWGKLWPFGRPTAVDPHGIAQAIIQAMRACDLRSAHGAPLVWNEFRLFLAREDFDALRAVLGRTSAALDTLIRRELARLGAETVGEPVVVLRYDEAMDIPAHRGILEVGFNETQARPDGRDQVTIRLGRPVAAPAPDAPRADPAGAEAPAPDETLPDLHPLRLRWGDQSVLVLAGTVARVGRPHAPAPPTFVPLLGTEDNMKINRVHVLLDHRGPVPVVHRPSDANPVHVGEVLVAAGSIMSLERLPAQITLANDQLVLTVEAG